MSTATSTRFKRDILQDDTTAEVTAILQDNLTNLIDLALLMKQAHWNVVGPNFRSVHLQLDEIIETVRNGSDEVAERIVTLGVTADGRVSTVAADSKLDDYPAGFVKTSETITRVADSLKHVIESLRSAIERLGELDAISEDLLIALSGDLEKHLWMVQAQEA
ncbi:DNA starvation/stationary phase protection protein Dps [Rhodopirellula sp. P2]|uniref:DNA starvation/stationary phase protection protein Dps n=1 Tax=Rhodopirellula sp. P2 TaxID=2127060 RepID=UPI0023677A76|nr:DNA starvation/stationary phase protection protein Dps [Rhodopirellula sp. P2]WDQ15014.1 DNA starvation/stationary phase protection protein Dps [Rhodopirellula sp. P2]